MTVTSLAAHNAAHIFFTGRSEARATEVIDEAKARAPNAPVSFLPMDLASFASIQEAATQLRSKTDRIDLLFCNAGIMAVPAGTTADGYEIQFGTNHLGHALLIYLLLPLLLQTAKDPSSDVRIVSNTSTGFKNPPPDGIEFARPRSEQDLGVGGRWLSYGQSKLANILFAREMATHHPQLMSVTIHPGVIKTDLVTSLSAEDQALVYASSVGKMLSAEDGVKNQLFAATRARAELTNGGFYEPVGVVGAQTELSRDAELGARLWEWTEGEIGRFLEG